MLKQYRKLHVFGLWQKWCEDSSYFFLWVMPILLGSVHGHFLPGTVISLLPMHFPKYKMYHSSSCPGIVYGPMVLRGLTNSSHGINQLNFSAILRPSWWNVVLVVIECRHGFWALGWVWQIGSIAPATIFKRSSPRCTFHLDVRNLVDTCNILVQSMLCTCWRVAVSVLCHFLLQTLCY